MAYEVVKRVGRRAYRYRVERYRDPEGVPRTRWVYLGVEPASGPAASSPGRRVTTDARRRLLDAFERVAERSSYAGITAGAVSAEAGLAHGTFYRYFRAKRDLLAVALERVREDLDRMAPTFAPPYGAAAMERERIRTWLAALWAPAAHPGLLRAFYEALENDAELRASRATRRRERVAALASYLKALAEAGTISPVRAESLAAALLTMLEATVRAAISRPGDAPDMAGVGDVFERAIFGSELASAAPVPLEKGSETAARTAAPGISASETRAPEPKVQ
ncbi:MAG: TetR/AcrR family transcriptional regulator [Candidatus Eremiobacteraeota bacterium]|nr:TetR/AcrR family transcriptional regulator [Candidatus Eremiobacteraeota bacterium]